MAKAVRRYAEPDRKRCVSCGACMNECPKGAISVWRGCFAVVDRAQCVGCGRCQHICPAYCITLKQREGEA